MKKINFKNVVITLLLILLLLFIIYSLIGIFITGPAAKNQKDDQKIMDKINESNKTCESITRHSFKFVTYTCEEEKRFVVYDAKGKQIGERDKSELRISEIETLIMEKYPNFKGQPIEIGYGKKHMAYVIEKGSDMLILDFNSLKVVFYSEGK